MKIIAHLLALLLLWTVTLTSDTLAQRPSRWESRDQEAHASMRVRRRAGGWEARSRHFAVFSPHSAGESQQIADEMEAAWEDMANLADHWMTVHRDPHFGTSSVNVRILSRGQTVAKNENPREIFLSGDRAQSDNQTQRLALRADSVRAFMNVSDLDRVLPQWVQEGLTSLVAGESEADLMRRDSTSHQPGAAWGRAMLEAHDGRHAWQLFDAIRDATVGGRPSRLTALARQLDLPQLAADWLKEPLAGQPILKTPADLDTETVAIVADMIDLWKLSKRFAPRTPQAVRPHVVGSGLAVADAGTATQQAEDWSLRPLRDELLGPAKPKWAMVDARGDLVTSLDRQNVEALFMRAQQRLQTVVERDQQMLRAELDDGRLVESWLADNRDDASRPLLHVRVRRADTASSGSESQEKKGSGDQ